MPDFQSERGARSPSAAAVRGYGLLTLCVVAALLVATGRPEPKALAQLAQWGFSDFWARAAVYAGPALTLVAMAALGRMLGRGWPMLARWAVYGLLGVVAGFVLGYCLELFAGVPGLMSSIAGPLGEAGVVEAALWTFGAFCMVMALFVVPVALFGGAGAKAIHVEEIDPEMLDVRRGERVLVGWSALGLAALGLASAALALARQVGPEAAAGPVAAAALAGLVFLGVSVWLWRGFDEMQRRSVMNAYAISAMLGTAGLFAWALGAALGLVEPTDAAGLFLILTIIQTIVTLYLSGKAMSDAGS